CGEGAARDPHGPARENLAGRSATAIRTRPENGRRSSQGLRSVATSAQPALPIESARGRTGCDKKDGRRVGSESRAHRGRRRRLPYALLEHSRRPQPGSSEWRPQRARQCSRYRRRRADDSASRNVRRTGQGAGRAVVRVGPTQVEKYSGTERATEEGGIAADRSAEAGTRSSRSDPDNLAGPGQERGIVRVARTLPSASLRAGSRPRDNPES